MILLLFPSLYDELTMVRVACGEWGLVEVYTGTRLLNFVFMLMSIDDPFDACKLIPQRLNHVMKPTVVADRKSVV